MIVNNLIELKTYENISLRKINDTYYVIRGVETYELNEIGAIIVNALGKDITVEELCNRILKKYNHDNIEQIKLDVNTYINFLINEKIINHEQ